MQVTVKETKVVKTGKGEYGEWKLVGVTTDDGKYTTFAKDAEKLIPGSVIEITDLNENEKGKSFKKYALISEPTKEEAIALAKEDKMTVDMWADKDRITRASIEGQVAMKCYTDLVVAKVDKIPSLLREAIELKIRGFTASSNTIPQKSIKTHPEDAEQDIKDYWPESDATRISLPDTTVIKKICEDAGMDSVALNKMVKENYGGLTWGKLSDEKKLEVLDILKGNYLTQAAIEMGAEIEPEDLPF